MSEQITVRIPESLARAVDALVESRRFGTRTDAVRFALETLVDREHRRAIGERIVDGYRRVPQDDQDVAAAAEAAIRSINEEPW